jgi:hypothetical protein
MRITLALLLVAACGGSHTQITMTPPPARVTSGTLAGPLCAGDHCSCRDQSAPGDGGAGVPDDGKKRFEIQIGPASNELWVTVQGNVLYKSPEIATACFYVDLSPGQHPVVLRASHKDGLSAAFEIHELGTKTKSWYDTFTFNCGSPGVCGYDDLDREKARIAAVPRSIHDKCGSVRIKGVQWDAGRSPDQAHPEDLQLGITLDIETWAPWKQHGDDTCGGPPPKAGAPTGDPATPIGQ